MKPAVVGFLALIAACGGTEPGSDPNSIALDREYVLSGCVPKQCSDFVPYGGHFTARVDSARLILRPDHTADWMIGTTGTSNPCYLQNKDCTVQTGGVYRKVGKYSFTSDTTFWIITPETGCRCELFATAAPSRVGRDWTGPDHFVWDLYPLYYRVTVRPQ